MPKWYLAQVPGPIGRDLGAILKEGIELDDGPVQVDEFSVVDSAPGKALLEIVIHEGRKHVVRRMLEQVGHPVERLVRTRIGSLRLGELPPGRTRPLNAGEVAGLFSPYSLYRGATSALTDEQFLTPPSGAAMSTAYFLVMVGLSLALLAALDELVAQSDEHREMLHQLELQADAETAESAGSSFAPLNASDLPTGDDLVAELERFLRDQG